jgi:hypothetical protein
VYDGPLEPTDPLKFNAILAVFIVAVRNEDRADKLAVVTDVAKFVLPNGYDCIIIFPNYMVRLLFLLDLVTPMVLGNHWTPINKYNHPPVLCHPVFQFVQNLH